MEVKGESDPQMFPGLWRLDGAEARTPTTSSPLHAGLGLTSWVSHGQKVKWSRKGRQT